MKALKQRCSVLTVENEALKAEVEIYRSEATAAQASSGTAKSATSTSRNNESVEADHFVKSGDGGYAKNKSVLLENCHGVSNVLCCSISNDESVLATGGADRNISLTLWNKAFGNETSQQVVESSSRVDCDAPVITSILQKMLL